MLIAYPVGVGRGVGDVQLDSLLLPCFTVHHCEPGQLGREWEDFGIIMYKFHSEILASLNFNKNKILSPELENNYALKCCSSNFPT